MKASTILQIDTILKNNLTASEDSYRYLKEALETRYKTEWIDKYLTDTQRTELNKAREEYHNALSIYEDFSNHQW